MTAADWISDRRALIDAATEGPWWTTRDMSPADVFAGYGSADDVALALDIEKPADAKLIADSRTSLPKALDALEAVLEQVSAMEALVTEGLLVSDVADSALSMSARGIRGAITVALGIEATS